MKIQKFQLERYFADYEFSTKYTLSSSDLDGLYQKDLLNLADDQTKKLWKDLQLGYTESNGLPLLRYEISQLYKNVDPDNILICTPVEGIFIALNTILGKGDHIISTFPSYQALYSVAESIGCEITKWIPDENNNWELNLEFLEKSIKPNTKLIIVNFPHNPTGYLPSLEKYNQIIEIARKHNIYIFSDEMYQFLEYDLASRLPAACDIYEKAVTLFGMSKTFGLAGLRIGWLVTKDRTLLRKMQEFKDFTSICSSAPSEILSLIALRNKEKIIEEHLKKLTLNLNLLKKFMDKYREIFSVVLPKAGTVCFPKLIIKEDSDNFCQNILKSTDILLLPSKVFEYGNSHFRIGFGRKNMPEVLSIFEKYLLEKYI